ncbi:MAG TPA: class I SAM-dependent methyltransferase [Bdellovibrionales bacterium]|nr:class I SAM-dependent methyltransferase [Bdellovibrionales bacterium]
MPSEAVYIWAETPEQDDRAAELAQRLGLERIEEPAPGSFCLKVGADHLELVHVDEDGRVPAGIVVDFASGPMRQLVRSAGKSQPLAKAVGAAKSPPYVLDATAGLGKDTLFLATVGCRVLALEKNPVIFALLEDGYRRGLEDGLVGEILRERVQFALGDSIEYLENIGPSEAPEVVYLDPMFPESKKSALPKKEMQIFRALIKEKIDEPRLFEAAVAKAKIRVVVKRPSSSEPLAEPITHRFDGKMVSYDSYLMSSVKPRYNYRTGEKR